MTHGARIETVHAMLAEALAILDGTPGAGVASCHLVHAIDLLAIAASADKAIDAAARSIDRPAPAAGAA